MEPKPIALSVLMTREEYMQLTVQIHRHGRRTRSWPYRLIPD